MVDYAYPPAFVGGGSTVYPPGGTFGPRTQPTYELVLVHSGWIDITVDGSTTRLEAGTVCLLKPKHREFWQCANDQPTRQSWIHLGFSRAPRQFHDFLRNLPGPIPLSPHMTGIMREVLYWTISPQSKLMLRAAGHYAISLYIAEAQEAANPRTTHEAVTLVEQYIHHNFRHDLTLSELANHASVSIEHLCRLFQQDRKTSPMAYLWEVRTEQALGILVSTKLPITKVADKCGFKNAIHLHRRVKEMTGLSPTQYRQRMSSSVTM